MANFYFPDYEYWKDWTIFLWSINVFFLQSHRTPPRKTTIIAMESNLNPGNSLDDISVANKWLSWTTRASCQVRHYKESNNTETESPPIKLTQTVAKRQNRPQLKAQVVSFADIKCNLTEIDLTEEQHGDVGGSRETLKIQKTWIWGTLKASQDSMKTFKIDDSLVFLRETEKPWRPMRVPI